MTSTNTEQEILVELLLCSQYGWKQHSQCKSYNACKICLDDLYEKYVLETQCGHCFDLPCIMETITKYGLLKCPECSKVYSKTNA